MTSLRWRTVAVGLVSVLLLAGTAAVANAGSRSRWVNHDNDNWAGSANPANPGFVTDPAGCDPVDAAQCLLPYPNDWFTRHDRAGRSRSGSRSTSTPRRPACCPRGPSARCSRT